MVRVNIHITPLTSELCHWMCFAGRRCNSSSRPQGRVSEGAARWRRFYFSKLSRMYSLCAGWEMNLRHTHITCSTHTDTHRHIHTRSSACGAFLARFRLYLRMRGLWCQWDIFFFFKLDGEWEGEVCRDIEELKTSENVKVFFLVGVMSLPKEERRCSSESCAHISADGFHGSSATDVTPHCSCELWHWSAQRWLSAGLGAVRSGCIVSGCLCNLDVHRKKAKFSSFFFYHDVVRRLKDTSVQLSLLVFLDNT